MKMVGIVAGKETDWLESIDFLTFEWTSRVIVSRLVWVL